MRLARARERTAAVQKRIGANEHAASGLDESIEDCRSILVETPPADDVTLATEIAALTTAVLGDEELTYKNAERAQTRGGSACRASSTRSPSGWRWRPSAPST
ncbi:hypothetical protein BKD30_06500 [Tersicoccus phoenicis]|uniref:Uncharacterized protein n=1 Tax=Tersicoccus phoenicis TaxID=554083 RepID=A0A1R1LCC3_9MICC|nr:hypothetical protein [Tersicoccus phoenicis]OMH25193.1 hypothetical protein BKD30_06500 [Tersicoccus phoenicis]